MWGAGIVPDAPPGEKLNRTVREEKHTGVKMPDAQGKRSAIPPGHRPAYNRCMSSRRARLCLELVVLWLGLVAIERATGRTINPFLVLWPGALICLFVMLADRRFDRRQLWNAAAVRKHLPAVLLRWALLGPVVVAAIWLITPDWFLGFPRRRPEIWAIVMAGYPIASVYPQGLVYRALFLHRYRAVGNGDWLWYVLSGVCFGWVHWIFFKQADSIPVAVILATAGGILFARTYLKSRSLLVSSIEHALYGCTIFTFGWGKFFYHGALQFSP